MEEPVTERKCRYKIEARLRVMYFYALKTKKIESELAEIGDVLQSVVQAASERAVFS